MKCCAIEGCERAFYALGLCQVHYNVARREKKADSERERTRAYYLANRERILRRNAAYNATMSAETVRETKKRYAAKHPEVIRARWQAWRSANEGYDKERKAAWSKENPDRNNAYRANRKARKLGVGGAHTAVQVKALFIKQKGKCAICKCGIENGYHRDHIVPLFRGGSNGIDNIQLLCRSCNQHKHARDPIQHMQSLGFLL